MDTHQKTQKIASQQEHAASLSSSYKDQAPTTSTDDDQKPVDLLWTGGWDSTFRLLELLFIEKRLVETWYIIDYSRISAIKELQTIGDISKAIIKRLDNPNWMLPTRFVLLDQILEDAEINKSFSQIKSETKLGGQYNWLARFAKQFEKENLEIGFPKHLETTPLYERIFQKDKSGHLIYTLKDDETVRSVFKRFSFPIITRTKADYFDIAMKNGFDDILLMTWFCHRPVYGKPCGVCNPCVQATEQGRDLGFSKLRPFVFLRRHYWPRAKRYFGLQG